MNPRTILGIRSKATFILRRTMFSGSQKPIYFGPFEVTEHSSTNALLVFHNTEHSFALCNLKPLLPGHVLICPHRSVPRLTSLTAPEITDLMLTTQRVQRMLAKHYFPSPGSPEDGSFNIAIQDGEAAGQSVKHVHVHIIPRTERDGQGDGIYDELAGEEGNVGGYLWDKAVGDRPVPKGKFPKIEDEKRLPRTKKEMREEAEVFRRGMEELERSEK